MGRVLTINIYRHNPLDRSSVPHLQAFQLDETKSMTLFIALHRIREEQDASLVFDFCCRAGVCGSCAMVINGRPGLACHTKTKELPDSITLFPLPVFKQIGDLAVDTGSWFREMYQNTESWIHTAKEFDPTAPEEPMDNALANQIYELDRCIECGCCVASCGTANMNEHFIAPAGFLRLARFHLDPRDERDDAAFYELIGTSNGVFGCMGLLACEDVCPKHLPLQTQLAFLRRKMGIKALRRLLPFGK